MRVVSSIIVGLMLCLCCFAPKVSAQADAKAFNQIPGVDSLLDLLRQPQKDVRLEVEWLNSLSVRYNPYKADSALYFAKLALEKSEKNGYAKGIAESCRNIGFSYQRIGKLADATSYYLRSVPLYEQMKDSVGLANVWNGLGISYFEQGDYGNALQFYQRAEPIFVRLGRRDRYAATLSNIGYAYLQLGNVYLAKNYIERALRIADELGLFAIQVFALAHLGTIATRYQEFMQAEALFNRALRVAYAHPENSVANSRLYLVIGNFYTEKREFSKARVYLDTSLAISRRASMSFRIKDAYNGLQRLAERMGNFEEAYKYQSLVVLYQDSLFNQESARQIATMQRELSSREQSAQIALLTKENELRQTTRNQLLIGITIVAGLVILVSFAYIRARFLNRRLQAQNIEIREQRTAMENQSKEIAAINGKLEEKNKHLLELNEEKSQFMRITAHDLKNPLTAIRGLSDYILVEQASMPKIEIVTLVSRINLTAERMYQLVKNLLDVNAIESGKFALKIQNFDALSVVESVVQGYMEQAKSKEITLSLLAQNFAQNPEELSNIMSEFIAKGDEQAFMQVMDNLVSNAIKYTAGGKRVNIKVFRERKNQGNTEEMVRVEVQDQGQGLTEEDKKLLFGKFTKLSARPTAGEDSTGLGLSIVKQLVEMMRGEVWCESEHGEGATFIVRLPAADVPSLSPSYVSSFSVVNTKENGVHTANLSSAGSYGMSLQN